MKNVTATEAKNQLGQVLESALVEPVTITKTGRKIAVVLSCKEYERLQALEDAWWAHQADLADAEGYIGTAASKQFIKRTRRNSV
jgi:prevent-host-death family protein